MSERTRKIKITTINSHGDYYIGNKYGYIAIVVADVLGPKNVAKANAKELVRRWNAFEDGGLVEELRTACEKILDKPELHYQPLNTFEIEALEAALAKS